jgi:hypothetical protein
MMAGLPYGREGGRLLFSRDIETKAEHRTYRVTFSGRDIRRERTGIHARVDIAVNGVTLAYSTFNVEKDEDRTRLANSAYKGYRDNGLAADYPGTFLKKDVDLFCDGLWDEQLKELMPEMVTGTDPVPPTFLLEPYIIEGGGTILFAPPGRGKSYTALLMAVAIDAGVNTSVWKVKQAPVLFLNLERSAASFRARLGGVNTALGLPRERTLALLNARGKSLADVYSGCERWVAEHETSCVVLDSLSRAGLGDMNDNKVGNKTIDLLNALTPTWFAPAHPPRNDATHVFGSQMFDAGADVIVQVIAEQPEEGPLGVGFQVTKVNDFRVPPMQVLAFEFDATGLTSIRRARPGEFPEVEHERKGGILTDIKEYLRDQEDGIGSATEIAEALGKNRSFIARILAARKEHFVFVRKEGKTSLYGIVGRPEK